MIASNPIANFVPTGMVGLPNLAILNARLIRWKSVENQTSDERVIGGRKRIQCARLSRMECALS